MYSALSSILPVCLSSLIFYALYAPARTPLPGDGVFPCFDIAYNAGGYYEYYSINVKAYILKEKPETN